MPGTLYQKWTATLEESPGTVAVIEAATGASWTRAQLDQEAARWAADLGGHSELYGVRFALSVPNSAEWFKVFLGLTSCGAIPVPIDPSEPLSCQMDTARSVGAPYLWSAGKIHSTGPMPCVRASARDSGSEALVKLTSGSSGTPKALGVTHAQLAADGRQICATMEIGPGDVNYAAIPLGYSYGLGNLVAPLILQGSPVVCASSMLPHSLAEDIANYRPSVFPAVPALLKALVEVDLERSALSSLRTVISAGSPLSPDVTTRFLEKFGVWVHGFYGTSETGGITYDRLGHATLEGRSVGTPLEGVQLEVSATGKLKVSSPAVLGSGVFLPADQGMLNAQGELVLKGRSDRVVKVAGRRLDLCEVESHLKALEGVKDCYACLASGLTGPLVAAVASDRTAAELKAEIRQRLASWKIPSRIVPLKHFPLTPRGKTDTAALRSLLSEAPPQPRSPR